MDSNTNGAIEIGNLMADMMRPAGSADAEILDVVAKYSLQLRLDQQQSLNKLAMEQFNELIPIIERRKIENFVPMYCNLKRYHDTIEYIGKAVDAMSLRRFMDSQAIKGQVIKA